MLIKQMNLNIFQKQLFYLKRCIILKANKMHGWSFDNLEGQWASKRTPLGQL